MLLINHFNFISIVYLISLPHCNENSFECFADGCENHDKTRLNLPLSKWPHTCRHLSIISLRILSGHHHHHHQNASIRAWMRSHKKFSTGYWWIFIICCQFSKKSKLITFFSRWTAHREKLRSLIHWTRSEENRRKLCANLKSNPLILHLTQAQYYNIFFY